jgi:hypothetical protein
MPLLHITLYSYTPFGALVYLKRAIGAMILIVIGIIIDNIQLGYERSLIGTRTTK